MGPPISLKCKCQQFFFGKIHNNGKENTNPKKSTKIPFIKFDDLYFILWNVLLLLRLLLLVLKWVQFKVTTVLIMNDFVAIYNTNTSRHWRHEFYCEDIKLDMYVDVRHTNTHTPTTYFCECYFQKHEDVFENK